MKTPSEIYDEVYQRMYRQKFVTEKEIAIQFLEESIVELIEKESYRITPYESFDSIRCLDVDDVNKFIADPQPKTNV